MAKFPTAVAPSRGAHSYIELREQIYRDPSLWSTYAELRRQIYRRPWLWGHDVISKRPCSSALAQLKKAAAVIALLGLFFWVWSAVATYRAPRATYPYYDTQKPVPAWTEPQPLAGNYNR